MLKQPLSNSTAKISMAVLSQSTKPVPAKTVLQAAVVAVAAEADALMALAATSVAVAAVVVMTAVAVAVVAAVDAATSVVVNSSR
jgi:hypothetical protein